MEFGLQDKRAAVAAASGGLGYAVAQALLAEGAHVAICSRNQARIEDAATSLGDGAVPLVADVADAEAAAGFVARAREALEGLDILVTNAGGPPPGGFGDTPLERYPDALALNLLSVVAMCEEAVPRMREQGWGRVVAVTSISVRQPIPGLILSNTARAGVTGYLKTVAREVAPDGVTVNSLQPGLHATARLEQIHGGDVSAAASGVPTRTVGRPEDFGAVAAFLCSDQARFITGAAIPVDGGAHSGLQ